MPEEESGVKVSEHNSSISIVIRLNSLWLDANNHSRKGRYLDWNNDLDAIWRELARDFEEADYQSYKVKFDEFEKKIAENGKFYDSDDGFEKPGPEILKKRDAHYKILMEKDLFLRRLENSLGKGTKWHDADEDDFE